MNPLFAAGFFAAWSAIYIATFGYALWSVRRKLAEPGELLLGLFALTLALFGVSTTFVELSLPGAQLANSVASGADIIASPILLHFVLTAEGRTSNRWFLAVLYGVFAVLVGLAMAGGLREVLPTLMSHRTPPLVEETRATAYGKAAHVCIALVVVTVTYVYARLFVTEKRGLAAFLGAVALSVTASYDLAMNFVDGSDNLITPFGYAAFTLGLFVSRLTKFTSRRDKLLQKTTELSDRSQALSKAFKELRAAQTELVRREQLAAIGELSAVVAHEVRNPLAVITNAVATLGHPEITADDRATLLKILDEETARLNHLVGDLLRYAKPLTPESQLVGLRDIVEKAIAHLKSRVDLIIEILEPVPVGRVAGDPLLLRQAVDNVVNNAVQAMPTGGTLTIELSRRGAGTEERLVVAFSDTGEGMDTVVRKRALDPFFTTRPAGTGLGLAIVARVVDAHGGELVIRSARDAGTEVSIVLPIDQDQAKILSLRKPRVSISSIPESPRLDARGRERISSSPEVSAERPSSTPESASSEIRPRHAQRGS